jgi:hypothetical protein
MSTIRVKPVDGARVRDPRTGAVIPAEGIEVTNETYWQRRLAAGDVVLDEPAAEKAPRTAATKRTGGDA